MAILKTQRSIRHLIILGIILTPLFTISDVYGYLFGTAHAVLDNGTVNIGIKFIKDFIFFLLIFIYLLTIISNNKRITLNKWYLSFFFLLFSSFFTTILTGGEIYMIIAGLRWAIPLIVLLAILKYVDDGLQHKIARVLIYLFVFAFVLQIIEFVFMPHFWGTNILGFNKRNPGFFYNNNTMAFYAILVFYYSLFFEQNKIFKIVIYMLLPFSVLMTSSGTGVIVLSVMYLYIGYRKIKNAYLKNIVAMTSIGLFALALLLLPLITGRSDILTSIRIRGEIFLDHLNFDHILVSDQFGSATNSGLLLQYQIHDEGKNGFFIADSTWTSIMVNISILGLILFGVMLFIIKNNSTEYYTFLLVFGLFPTTTIVFEAYPMNLLLAVNIAYFYGKRFPNAEAAKLPHHRKSRLASNNT